MSGRTGTATSSRNCRPGGSERISRSSSIATLMSSISAPVALEIFGSRLSRQSSRCWPTSAWWSSWFGMLGVELHEEALGHVGRADPDRIEPLQELERALGVVEGVLLVVRDVQLLDRVGEEAVLVEVIDEDLDEPAQLVVEVGRSGSGRAGGREATCWSTSRSSSRPSSGRAPRRGSRADASRSRCSSCTARGRRRHPPRRRRSPAPRSCRRRGPWSPAAAISTSMVSFSEHSCWISSISSWTGSCRISIRWMSCGDSRSCISGRWERERSSFIPAGPRGARSPLRRGPRRLEYSMAEPAGIPRAIRLTTTPEPRSAFAR